MRALIHRSCFQITALLLLLALAGTARGLAPETKRTLVTQVPPTYPTLARKMRLEGTVSLEIVVQPDGHVGSATVLAGHPLLRDAAKDAVHQWRYAPAPDESTSTVQIVFQLTR